MKQTVTIFKSKISTVFSAFILLLSFSHQLSAQGIQCPADITVTAPAGSCEAAVSLIPTLLADTCTTPNNPINNSPYAPNDGIDASGNYPVGSTVVGFSICDSTQQCSVTVNVNPPAPQCITKDVNVYLDASGVATVIADSLYDGTACTTLTYAVSPASFTCDSLGVRMVQLTVTDTLGQSSTCTASVTVIDTLAPTCPNVPDMVLQLAPNKCDTTFVFDLPTAMDNCTAAPVSTAIPGQPASGDAFTVGTHEILYTVVDDSMNMDTCSFNIVVEEYIPLGLACLSSINLSLDAISCTGEVTNEMVLTGDLLGCVDSCKVEIMDEAGNLMPNLFTVDHVGKSFMYRVSCGDLSCMGTVNIEDKAPPVITCTSDTITCAEQYTYPEPTVEENCTGYTLTLLNKTIEQVDCSDTLIQFIEIRLYQAVDAFGNKSDTCSQRLSVLKFDIGDVEPPLTTTFNFACDDVFPTDSKGNPDPIVYGSPRLGGQNLWPSQNLDCNLMVNYSDQKFQAGINKTTIARTWTASNWYCGQDTTATFVQFFHISDEEGPSMTCPNDMTLSTSGLDCTANIELPAIQAVDACAEVKRVTIQYQGGFIDANGGLAHLPTGKSTVTYTAYDTYNNSSSCSFEVFVKDNEQPVAICDQFTTVALTVQGYGEVMAKDVDNGSFDACGDLTYQIRKMNPTCYPSANVFADSVRFCCEEIGQMNQVVMRVTDPSGNFNECMVEVEVQDKIKPQIVKGLPDITVSCEFPIDLNNPSVFGSIRTDEADIKPIQITADSVRFSVAEPTDGLVLGNCVELIEDQFQNLNINSCGTGFYVRYIRFRNQQGLTAWDQQVVTVVNPEPFVGTDITWPKNISFNNQCGLEGLEPDNLPEGHDRPKFVEDACDKVGITKKDQVIDETGSLSCFKIIRTWTVADWCQKEKDGTFKTWTKQQIIQVTNTNAPTLTGACKDISVCSYDPNCGPMYVELAQTATDDCTEAKNMRWKYEIDAFSNNTIDFTGTTNNASAEYPVGIHTIHWTVSDGCGNEDKCSYVFEVKNCKAATPYCLDNLTAGLVPWDMDADGTADTEMVMITPSYIDAGSAHPCSTEVRLSFSTDVNDTLRTFGCNDIGEQALELWVTDVNGNQSYCSTSLVVQDNNTVDLCPEVQNVSISGLLKTQAGETIGQGEIALTNSTMQATTADDGVYNFADMPTGGSYVIVPTKDIEAINGVSTLDIILIQKHILGIEVLDSPHKLIAADVNNSKSINGSDIIQLRKLILGHYETFPNNTSWRFIDENQKFVNPLNPWLSDLEETYSINSLNENMVVNFHGIKIGDVNYSAAPNSVLNTQADTRSDKVFALEMEAQSIAANTTSWIPVYASSFDYAGFQFAMNYDLAQIDVLSLRGVALDMNDSNFKIDATRGVLNVVWSDVLNPNLDADQVLFEIQVQTKTNVRPTEVFNINDQMLKSEAYNTLLEAEKVEIQTRKSTTKIETEVTVNMNQNEPNPWNDYTSIEVETNTAGAANLRLMSTDGQVVFNKELVLERGTNLIQLSGNELNLQGIIYYELSFGGKKLMKKMVKIK